MGVASVEAPRTRPVVNGADWTLLSMTGCVMYCLMMVAWGEGAGFVAAIFGFSFPNAAPDAPDVLSDQSSTEAAADATCARGIVLATCVGGWWMPNRERNAVMTAATNPFI